MAMCNRTKKFSPKKCPLITYSFGQCSKTSRDPSFFLTFALNNDVNNANIKNKVNNKCPLKVNLIIHKMNVDNVIYFTNITVLLLKKATYLINGMIITPINSTVYL